MSIFDDFNSKKYDQPVAVPYNEPYEAATEAVVLDSGFVPVANIDEVAPMFALNKVQFKPTGTLLHMVVRNDIIAVALDNCHLLRIDLSNPSEIEDIEVTKRVEDKVHNIFFDPTGKHLLISLDSGDNFYLNSRWKKVKALPKLKGLVIDSVAWNRPNKGDVSTREILLGTTKGQIYETEIEPTDKGVEKDEKYVKLVYKLPEVTPITGLCVEPFPQSGGKKFFVIVTTATRIYQFVGTVQGGRDSVFDSVFANYSTNAGFLELPGDLSYSELDIFRGTGMSARSFAWLTGPGVYHGQLVFSNQGAGENVIDNAKLMPYPTLSDKRATPISTTPLSLTVTDFHYLLLYADRLVAVGRLNEQVVYEELLPRRAGQVRKIAADPVKNTLWAYTSTSIFEIVVSDEDRNIWEHYLGESQFELALQFTKNSAQKDKVYSAQADFYFAQGRYQLAAKYYALTQKSFEEITLKLIRKDESEALKTFLVNKLDTFKKEDATQVTLLCTWLVEIFLNKLNDARERKDDTEYKALQQEFFEFLAADVVKAPAACALATYLGCQGRVNHQTTYTLIASHGLVEEMLYFAKLVGDYERVITHYIQAGQFVQALATMRQQSRVEVYYRFSPVLMEKIPYETVTAWIAEKALEPKQLIPSIMKYDSARITRIQDNQAIRYLQYCVQTLRNEDQAIHNLLLSLYVQQSDDTPLLQFLRSDRRYYDLQYALRLCTQHGKAQACILIYSAMGLYEEAVELALKQQDLVQAKLNADEPAEDEALRKKLWLRIARHVVEEKKDIRTAMAFLRECDLLKIEDVLPFFPDFVLIDDFKDEISAALTEYNEHIEDLKHEMDSATQSAEAIRRDIRDLRNKYGFIGATDKCRLCNFPLLTRQFYLFPCQHCFHADCLTTEVLNNMTSAQRARVFDLQQKLNSERQAAAAAAGPAKEGDEVALNLPRADQVAPPAALSGVLADWQAALDDLLAADCPLCGDIMIKSTEKPFIASNEIETIRSWEL